MKRIANNKVQPDRCDESVLQLSASEKPKNIVRVCGWTRINLDTGELYQPQPGDIISHGISPMVSQIFMNGFNNSIYLAEIPIIH